MIKIVKGFEEFSHLIVDILEKICTSENNNKNLPILDFKVEELPTQGMIDDLIKNGETEKSVFTKNGTGQYGIATIQTPFDSESVTVAFDYYGGMDGVKTVSVPTAYDVDWTAIFYDVFHALHGLLRLEQFTGTPLFMVYSEN